MPKTKTQKQLSFSEDHVPEACSCFLTIRGRKSLAVLPKKFRIDRQRLLFYVKA